jgi:hypothetical protein
LICTLATRVPDTIRSVKKRWVALALVVVSIGVASCDPTEDARAITIRNDTAHPVVLQVCDSFTCNNLNDRLRPGEDTPENVSVADNPYEFLVVNDHGKRLGCLEVATSPVPDKAVRVSRMTRCQ